MMSRNERSTQASSSETLRGSEKDDKASLRLHHLPAIFVLPTHLSVDELESIETRLSDGGAPVTYDISEASLILGAVNTARRVKFELNTRNIAAEVLESGNEHTTNISINGHEATLGKRKREDKASCETNARSSSGNVVNPEPGILTVGYTICLARIRKPAWLDSKLSVPAAGPDNHHLLSVATPLRASTETVDLNQHQGRRFNTQRKSKTAPSTVRPSLIRESTAEHDRGLEVQLPPQPAWVREGKVYACQRVTLAESPNEEFLDLLERIRLSRILIEDQIGVRAYSTSIASLAAYPHKFKDPREIHQLPGCDQKVETLFREYQSTGDLVASRAIEDNDVLRVIRDFYNIWGVGAKTAREWYFDRGWRDHDDIIQYGWNDLSRVQQIGLKFFDEFELKIPREEVEAIAGIVDEHAKALTDNRMTCTIVGGYRRGKRESGDVDIILSHPDEPTTHYFIQNLLVALEESGWITHTLTLSEANSQRDQQTLGLRVDSSKGGFDTLDKALLVWQDPDWPAKAQARAQDPNAKNPNVHRRVDIIISPWRTVGCAIAGWSSGTTFQRDLRRFAKHKHGWKFDSSGVRDRVTGRWIDLEKWSDPQTRAKTPLEAEKRVFEGMGLEYRAPSERCTR